MKINYLRLLLILQFIPFAGFSQLGKIHGKVYNSINNEPLAFVSLAVQGTKFTTITDMNGLYEITGMDAGYYDLSASYVGFESQTIFEIQVTNTKHAEIDFALVEKASSLKQIKLMLLPAD